MADEYNTVDNWGIPARTEPNPVRGTEAEKDEDALALPGDPLANWALKKVDDARPRMLKWRKQAMECDRFDAGHHFPKADEDQMRADRRPMAVFNAAQKWLRYIGGLESQMRRDVRFMPRQMHDANMDAAADLVSSARDWAIENCDGGDERSRAFKDMLRRGMGWTVVLMDRSHDASGEVRLRWVDGMEMLWDTRSVAQNVTDDARWIARERQMSKGEAMRRWGTDPKARDAISVAAGQSSSSGKPHEATLISEKEAVPIDGGVDWPMIDPGNVRVLEFQWKEEVPGIFFVDPFTEKDEWLGEEEFAKFHSRYKRVVDAVNEGRAQQGQPPLPPEVEHDRVLMEQCRAIVIVGREIVAGPVEMPERRFSFNCITGQWDNEDRIWYGFYKVLIDPQRYMTKFANQVMEILLRSAKGGLYAETDAFRNAAQAEAEHSRAGSITWVAKGAIAGEKFKEKTASQLPAGAVEMFVQCSAMMKEVAGIDPAVVMATGGNDVPEVTLAHRQAAGQLLLTAEFDAYDKYLAAEARTLFGFLKLIADNRWVRVGGPFNSRALQLIKQSFFMEYDVVLDSESSRDPYIRQQQRQAMERLAPTLLRTGALPPAEVLDLLLWGLPAEIKQSVKQAAQRYEQSKQQMSALGLQQGGRGKPTSIHEIQARTKKLEADAAFAQARAAALADETQSGRAKMLLDAYIKQLEMQQRREQQATDFGHKMMQGASKEALGVMNVLAARGRGGPGGQGGQGGGQ